jgi:bifunctional DNA primase/polymerase-like protein
MSSVFEALKLAKRDIAVFPCGADKRPLTKKGFKDASVDTAQVKEWWRRHPDALVGVPTGEKLVVIDCDLQHQKALGWYFDHAVRQITRKHATKSGGRHLLFKPDDRVGCSAGKIHPHIDTRGKGGYIIWWAAEGLEVLHGGVLAELPECIIERLNKEPDPVPIPARPVTLKSAGRQLEGIIGAIATAPEGQRNSFLHWGACRLSEMVQQSILAADDAFALLIEAGARTSLPYAEVSRTAKRIIKP